MGFLCMMCGEERNDAPTGGEEDEYGDWWTYCRKCDCWTSHPAESEHNQQRPSREEE